MKDPLRSKEGNPKTQVKLPNLHIHKEKAREVSAYGGVSLLHQLMQQLHFFKAIDEKIKILKIHQGYRESDHLFHLLCGLFFIGASCLEDVGQLQGDGVYKKLLGIEQVSDPSTLGDFLRRFKREDLHDLKEGIWSVREKAWSRLKKRRRRRAGLDLDSKICEVYGQQKQGADYTYKGS